MRPQTLVAAVVVFFVVAATVVAIVAITGNARGVDEIQSQREQSIRTSCADVNERHDNTLDQLELLLAKARETATPAELEEMEQDQAGVVALLEAIVPRRDCEALVRRSVGDP